MKYWGNSSEYYGIYLTAPYISLLNLAHSPTDWKKGTRHPQQPMNEKNSLTLGKNIKADRVVMWITTSGTW